MQNWRIQSLISLGKFLENESDTRIQEVAGVAQNRNGWFTADSITHAFRGIRVLLDEHNLTQWLQQYTPRDSPRKVGVVMAGNIPMVGFHDLLCILLSGNEALIKLSRDDDVLIPFLCEQLIGMDNRFATQITFVDKLQDMDAVIATGSDNSSRYFEHYFSRFPHIIRKNRTSVGILDGTETNKDLGRIGDDIFPFFGLGCRNVSKLFVPEAYDFSTFFEAIEQRKEVAHVSKYVNNYDYNKSIYLVNKVDFKDNGFLLLKEDKNLVAPISVLFYETYRSEEQLSKHLKGLSDKIQVIVSKEGSWPGSIPFGETQRPRPWDYADNIDTMSFLTGL